MILSGSRLKAPLELAIKARMIFSLTPACVNLMTCPSELDGWMPCGNAAGTADWSALSDGAGCACARKFCGRMAAHKATAKTVALKMFILNSCVFIFQRSAVVLLCRIRLDSWTISDRNHSI